MERLQPLYDIGIDVSQLPESARKNLEELTDDEIRILANIQKKAIDAGVGSPTLGGGGSGSCIY